MAEWERRNIRERTRSALEGKKRELKEKGFFISKEGKRIERLGRPERIIDWNRVDEYRSKGLSLSAVAKLMDFNYIWFLSKVRDHKFERATSSPSRVHS